MTELKKCVYCKKERMFNREHVFPVSLGGDDSEYILEHGVCEHCNNDFSKLEAMLARDGMIGMYRFYMMPPGKNSKVIPKLYSSGTALEKDSEQLLEVETHHGYIQGKPLPQVIKNGTLWRKIMPNDFKEEKLFAKLESLFSANQIYLVRKIHGNSKKFSVRTLTWKDDNYIESSEFFLPTPPKNSLWLESFKKNKDDDKFYHPRIYIKKNNTILKEEEGHSSYLSFLKEAKIVAPLLAAQSTMPIEWKPLEVKFVNHSALKAGPHNADEATKELINSDDAVLTVNIEATETIEGRRALAKIAMNFLIKCAGPSYALNEVFDKNREFILKGSGPNDTLVGIDQYIKNSPIFGKLPDHTHGVYLSWEPDDQGRCEIIFIAKLYKAVLACVLLSKSAPIPPMPRGTYFVIDYTNNTINSYNWDEYYTKFGVDLNQFISNKNSKASSYGAVLPAGGYQYPAVQHQALKTTPSTSLSKAIKKAFLQPINKQIVQVGGNDINEQIITKTSPH